jgi:hypothetical protein
MMSNRDHLVDGLHSILEELWNGSDQIAASELRELMAWRVRAIRPVTPTYRAGTFPAPISQAAENLGLLEDAQIGLCNIQAALSSGDANIAAQRVKDLLSSLSERSRA